MGTRGLAVQALLLYHAFRGGGTDGDTKRELQIPASPPIFRQAEETDRYDTCLLVIVCPASFRLMIIKDPCSKKIRNGDQTSIRWYKRRVVCEGPLCPSKM